MTKNALFDALTKIDEKLLDRACAAPVLPRRERARTSPRRRLAVIGECAAFLLVVGAVFFLRFTRGGLFSLSDKTVNPHTDPDSPLDAVSTDAVGDSSTPAGSDHATVPATEPFHPGSYAGVDQVSEPGIEPATEPIAYGHSLTEAGTLKWAEPSIAHYAFSSLDDFRTYCLTGSTDPADYAADPSELELPAYEMADGAFVDPFLLFPALDPVTFAVGWVEVITDKEYAYSWLSEDGSSVLCDVQVSFLPDGAYDSLDDFAYANYPDSLSSFFPPPDVTVYYADYFGATAEQLAESSAKTAVFAFSLDDHLIRYTCKNGELLTVSVCFENYVIRVIPRDASVLDDDALAAFRPLFADGDERRAALDGMAQRLKNE